MSEVPYEVRVRQFFHASLTEKEGQALIGHIQGTKRYGLLVTYTDLPEQAKVIIRAQYDETQKGNQ